MASQKTICEMFKNINYDSIDEKGFSEEAKKLCAGQKTNMLWRLNKPDKSLPEKLYNLVKQKVDLIAEVEELSNVEPKNVTKKQINLALLYMKFHLENDPLGMADINLNDHHSVIVGQQISVFEILLDIFYIILSQSNLSVYSITGNRFAALDIISSVFNIIPESFDAEENITLPRGSRYCTLLVTEFSDIESATDVLADAFNDNTSLWKLRNLIVQESIQEKFIKSLIDKLRPFTEIYLKDDIFMTKYKTAIQSANKMGLQLITNTKDDREIKPTIILGQNRNFFDDGFYTSPVFIMNIFRTTKEAISILNSCNGGSVSIWSDILSIAYEIAYSSKLPTVWINCHGKLNPELSFSFKFGDFTYGTKYAILEKYIKLRKPFKEQSGDPVARPKNLEDYNFVKNIKQYHFECISSEMDSRAIDTFLKFDDYKYCENDSSSIVIGNILFNNRKVIVFPFGETFGN